MNEKDREYICRFFIRVMCNQALIMTALGTVVTNQVIAKELMDNGQALAKELKEAAELVRLEK